MLRAFLLSFFFAVFVYGAAFEKAYNLYKEGEFAKALVLFEKLVKEENDYDAAYILGYMYEHGEGCEVDVEKSQHYYKLSSRGYYWKIKEEDPNRDIKKVKMKIYNSLDKPTDQITRETLKQYTQSLYSIEAHHANYFLPFSYRGGSHYADTNKHKAKDVEVEFQVSLKYDFAADVFGFDETYTLAYSQKSFWQLYADSAYFRETNYNPEFFITLPFSYNYLKGLRFNFAHQSNGRGGEEERSWNYVNLSAFFQFGFAFVEFDVFKDVLSLEYNKDLMDYMGYTKVQLIVPYKEHILKLSSRHTFSKYRALEASYTYPVFGSKTLFFYAKAFSGYGESLIDYDHKLHKFGIGFSLSR